LTVQALYRDPRQGSGVAGPAVIYNHGKAIEDAGGWEQAVAGGYDLSDFVDALAEAGYVALAPVRPAMVAAFGDWRAMIEGGIAYLEAQPTVEPGRVFMMGFSKGGLLSFQVAALDDSKLGGLMLMSPAPGAGENGWAAWQTAENLGGITVPVLVTLGELERPMEIGTNVLAFVEAMRALGKEVESHTDYAGADHAWFRQVRDEYWRDVLAWLAAR
jgi:dienelactone hydrolase